MLEITVDHEWHRWSWNESRVHCFIFVLLSFFFFSFFVVDVSLHGKIRANAAAVYVTAHLKEIKVWKTEDEMKQCFYKWIACPFFCWEGRRQLQPRKVSDKSVSLLMSKISNFQGGKQAPHLSCVRAADCVEGQQAETKATLIVRPWCVIDRHLHAGQPIYWLACLPNN